MKQTQLTPKCLAPKWRDTIKSCIRKRPTDIDNMFLAGNALAWNSCAIGEAVGKVDRTWSPVSDTLRFLGEDFHRFVKAGHYEEALKTLDRIDDHADQVQKERNHLRNYI